MRVTPDMKVADVLKINEHMIDAFMWISDSFEPLRNPEIMHGLTELRDNEDVLLVRHVLDPIALRDLFASCGFASWAEERRANEWYIYFYRPTAVAGAAVDPSPAALNSSRSMAAGA